ncbi:DUF2784 domain-containing protein [Desulfococcus multivorans]|uniref:DUF2784 domain-containing protein n=1 Tax=Desulfococcus multivorans DSM 2059 TaxID=1121405 RepID=S7TVJ2_DESML|nr:DUF2784 domain-containing protein [Desulfococcus multivorans]AOY57048.1 conserved uncharacterized protein [Desulfococcus multivorans]AQU99563.2 hypothetical protein B2D07_01360 [Desulfococcus multivorans]EPR40755.1 Protein of unknown function DUF2784 [Desulfococcus multivorans DSM 2059]SJZ88797.1 Protein of Unknown function [Desulfococcus multivorans DSM 2059]
MIASLLADAVVVLHFAFILFVVAGGILVLRWPRLMWLHLPAVGWGALIEFLGWICPLTPLENRLRSMGGEVGYPGGFIETYLTPIIYPEGLTRGHQFIIGIGVVSVNVLIYEILLRRRLRRRRSRI